MQHQSLRSRLLAISTILTLLFTWGCSAPPSEEITDSSAAVSNAQPTPEISDIQVLIPANDLAIGTPRIPFLLRRGGLDIENAASVTIDAFDLSQTPPTFIWQGPAQGYSDYEVPYWVFYPEIEGEAGTYGFQATISFDDQSEAVSQFAVELAENEISLAVGDNAFASQNRILADGFEMAELSSDTSPEAYLYENRIVDLLANERPAVISFSTPAFCQTAICAPVLNAVKATHAEYGEGVDFVHIEIYKDFDTLEAADEVIEWRLQSEPWTFVVDSRGVIQSRLGGPVSTQELGEILETLK